MAAQKLTLVVKIGTAALGASDGMPDRQLLGNLVGELAALKAEGHTVILVSSGAVGTGRALLRQGQPLQHCSMVAERQILASLGQSRLITLYQELLAPHHLHAAQILLTKQDFRTRAHHKHMQHLFASLREQHHILPIINENDSVTVDELMFTDNDELAGLLASMMNADRLLILSHIAGVYDRPPDEAGAVILPRIDWAEKKSVPGDTNGKSKTGRGGMTAKLASARRLAALGITTHIAAAREPRILTRLLAGESVGTEIRPLPRKSRGAGKTNAVKRWLASEVGKAPAAVTANSCLADMLRQPAQALSLLPVGLTKITGDFGKGDLVQILDDTGARLAVGIARYDATALRQALGKKRQPVFIHYDQLHRVSAYEWA